jgi:hypothetical protein
MDLAIYGRRPTRASDMERMVTKSSSDARVARPAQRGVAAGTRGEGFAPVGWILRDGDAAVPQEVRSSRNSE